MLAINFCQNPAPLTRGAISISAQRRLIPADAGLSFNLFGENLLFKMPLPEPVSYLFQLVRSR